MKKRVEYIDTVKGICSLLVILGHQLDGGELQRVIYSFHVPLFFIISGMFLNNEVTKSENDFRIVFRKANRLLWPYFTYTLLFLITAAVIITLGGTVWYASSFKELFLLFLNSLVGNGIGTLWFLPCLFLSSVLFILLVRKKKEYLLVSLSVLGLVGAFVYLNNNIEYGDGGVFIVLWDIFRMGIRTFLRALVVIPFLVFGYLFEKYKKSWSKHIFCVITICTAIWFLGLQVTDNFVDIASLKLGNVFWFYVNAVTASIAIISLFSVLVKKENWFNKIVGRNSLLYMVYNGFPLSFWISDILGTYIAMESGENMVILNFIAVCMMETFLVLVTICNKYTRKLVYVDY